MNRAQKYFQHLPKGTHFEKVIDTEYGKEKIYVSPNGKKHSISIDPDTFTWEFQHRNKNKNFTQLIDIVSSSYVLRLELLTI